MDIDNARRKKRWTKHSPQWITMGHTTESTLKRFLRGDRITTDTFISICEAVGLPEWQTLVDWEDKDIDSTRVGSSPSETVTAQKTERQTTGRLAVSGLFEEEKRQEICIVLEHLQTLLKTGSVTISPSKDDNK